MCQRRTGVVIAMKLLFTYFFFESDEHPSISYRGLSNIGLNFSTTHNFKVEKAPGTEKRRAGYKLTCQEKKKEDQLPIGFWGDRIYNVSALVGDNGVGKSTLLHSLIKAVVMGLEPEVPFLAVLQKTDSREIIVYCSNGLNLDTESFDGILLGVQPTYSYPQELKKTKTMLLDNTLSVSSINLDKLYSEKIPLKNKNNRRTRKDICEVPIPEWVKQFYNKSLVASIRYSNEMSSSGQPRYYYPIVEELHSHYRYESYQEIRFLFDNFQQGIIESLIDDRYPFPRPRYVYVDVFSVEGKHQTIVDRLSSSDMRAYDIPPACKNTDQFGFWPRLLAISLYVLYSTAYEALLNCRHPIIPNLQLEINRICDNEFDPNNPCALINKIYDNEFDSNNPCAFAIKITEEVESLSRSFPNFPREYREEDEILAEIVKREAFLTAFKTIKDTAQRCRNFVKFISDNFETLSTVFQSVNGQESEDLEGRFDQKINIAATNADPQKQRCVIEFLEHYREASRTGYYMLFSTGLSSGEKNLLRMITQFRYVLTNPVGSDIVTEANEPINNGLINQFENYQKDDNVVEVCDTLFLFLDEADLTYHPDWQREFVSLLTAILPRMFESKYGGKEKYGCKDIQVIMATHSPLLLSDIPKQSCVFMKASRENNKEAKQTDKGNETNADNDQTVAQGKDANKEQTDPARVVLVDNAIIPQTFGANIHGILNNSFFVSRTIGEFAYKRITTMFDNLNALKDNPDDKELLETCKSYNYEIDMIGDPLVHSKLRRLYDRVVSDNVGQVATDIEAILHEKRELTKEERIRLIEVAEHINRELGQ